MNISCLTRQSCTANKETFWAGNKKLLTEFLERFEPYIHKITSSKSEFLMTLIKLRFDFLVWHDKVALLTRRRSERGTRNYQQRVFRKVWTIYTQNNMIKKWIFDDPDKIAIRLSCLTWQSCTANEETFWAGNKKLSTKSF